jgi:hypothetical protein
MKAELHRQKAERIERSLSICTPTDWEIQIEGAMLAGTHWANYALHQRGVTADSEDIVHTTMTILAYLRKYQLAEEKLLGALTEIEELRPLYVRGDVPGGAEAGARAIALLSVIRDRASCL